MKRILILLLLVSNVVLSQNLNIPDDGYAVLENSNWSSITVGKRVTISYNGTVNVQNLNLNGQGTRMYVNKNATVNIGSSTNLNGPDSLFVEGKYYTSALEIQGNKAHVSIKDGGLLQTFGSAQLINSTASLNVCGILKVGENLNIGGQAKSGALTLCNCGVIEVRSLTVDADNVVVGNGTITITDNVNLNHILTKDATIFVKYAKSVNTPSNWGAAKVNSTTSCGYNPLPVIVKSTKFTLISDTKEQTLVHYEIVFTEFTGTDRFVVQYSYDAKNWVDFTVKVDPTNLTNKYVGDIIIWKK